MQEHGLEFTNSISKQRAENFLQYPGETYADNFKRPSTGGFSTTRSGGQSIASLYMCSQGYPIEDIVDPTKLIEEKQVTEAAKADTNGAIKTDDEYYNAYPIIPLGNAEAAQKKVNESIVTIMGDTGTDRIRGALGQIAADRAQHNYILDSYKNAQQKDPNKPFTKMLPPEFAVESGKISAAGTALGNDKNSPLALLANDPELARKHKKT